MRTMLALLFPLLLIPQSTSSPQPAADVRIAVQFTNRQDPALERVLAGMISEERMQEAVRSLCAFGPRMGGTSSGDATGPLSLTPAEGAVWLTSGNPSAEDAAGCLAVLHEGRSSPSGWPTPGRLRGEWNVPVFRIASLEADALRARLGLLTALRFIENG